MTKVSHLYVAEAASNSKLSKVSLIECTSKRQLDGHSKSSHVFIDGIVVVIDSIFVVNGIYVVLQTKKIYEKASEEGEAILQTLEKAENDPNSTKAKVKKAVCWCVGMD